MRRAFGWRWGCVQYCRDQHHNHNQHSNHDDNDTDIVTDTDTETGADADNCSETVVVRSARIARTCDTTNLEPS